MKRFKKILKFIGLVLLVLTLNLFPMALIAAQDKTPAQMQWLAGLGYLLIASAIVVMVWKKYKSKDQITKLPFTWKDFGIAFLFYLATRLIAIAGTFLIQIITGNAMSANDAALMATNEQLSQMFPLYFIAFHVAIGVFAPIMEELVFRGFFSRYFFQSHSKKVTWLVSTSIFALLHITYPIEFLMYFALGTIFYLAYARRENLVDSIVVHLLNNGLLVLISVVNYLILIFG